MWLCPSNANARYLSGHFFEQKSFYIYDSNFRGIVRQGSAVYILFIINYLACKFPTRGLTRLAVRLAGREDPSALRVHGLNVGDLAFPPLCFAKDGAPVFVLLPARDCPVADSRS